MINIFLIIFLGYLAFVIGVFVYSNMLLPLIWLPYVIFKIIRNDLKTSAIFMCILPPIIWFIIIFVIGIIDTLFLKSFILKIIQNNGFYIGSILALIITLLNSFSLRARIEFKENLNSYIKF